MKVGVENRWRLNGIKIPSTRATSFESHRFDLVSFATLLKLARKNKVKYSTVKCKHCSAVLVYFAKMFREISVEFKGVKFYSM